MKILPILRLFWKTDISVFLLRFLAGLLEMSSVVKTVFPYYWPSCINCAVCFQVILMLCLLSGHHCFEICASLETFPYMKYLVVYLWVCSSWKSSQTADWSRSSDVYLNGYLESGRGSDISTALNSVNCLSPLLLKASQGVCGEGVVV